MYNRNNCCNCCWCRLFYCCEPCNCCHESEKVDHNCGCDCGCSSGRNFFWF